MFGKSFEDKVTAALEKVRGSFPRAQISASVADKIVTLKGEAPDLDTKGRIMAEFNKLVDTDNTINQISIPKPAGAPAAAGAAPAPQNAAAAPRAAGGPRVHEVVRGDTLSAIAKKYYGSANKYTKIFEANRDILDDPDKIKPGQKLTIPD
ncbi:MAG TPA: LysM peptidoglycan-binding domain-containing protein [Thermoanaerobaculia bacterium]